MKLKEESKHHFGLTLLMATVIFCVLLISVALTVLTLYLLTSLGVITGEDGTQLDTGTLLLFMSVLSLVIGSIFSVIFSRISLRPVNHMISQMNRIASGDFSGRFKFGRFLSGHPSFVEMSESFNKMAQELENTELLRNDFVNSFSHEFKTPIVSIAGFAKLLRRGNLEPEQEQEYLAIIEEESIRLADMATNVLNLSKIEKQTILTDVSRYNLSEQLRFCVLLLENKWSRKNIEPDLELEEHYICANEELLKQVWINLLDNAIKFSDHSSEIPIRIKEGEDRISVTITNYGSDIPKQHWDKIFNKFYQVDESRATQGNGVGLAVVKYVVNLHKGSVTVESGGGKTSFTVSLPKENV